MKKITLLLSIAALLTSCGKKDKECAEWMEGDNCQTQTRAKYFGSYMGSSTDQDGDVINDQGLYFDGGTNLNQLLLVSIGATCNLSASSPGNFTINGDLDLGNLKAGEGSSGQFKGDSLYMHLILDDSVNHIHQVMDFKCKKQ
jgi:hypothetical protein